MHTQSRHCFHWYHSVPWRLQIWYSQQRDRNCLILTVMPCDQGHNHICCDDHVLSQSTAMDRCQSDRCLNFSIMGWACWAAWVTLYRSMRSKVLLTVSQCWLHRISWSTCRQEDYDGFTISVVPPISYHSQNQMLFGTPWAIPKF